MREELNVGNMVSICDSSEDGRVQIGVGQYKDPLLVSIYGVNGMETYIIITIIFMIEAFKQQRVFFPILATQYYRSLVANDYFWLARDVSLLEETHVFLAHEDNQQEGFSNLWKRKVFCRDEALSTSLHYEEFNVNEEIDIMMDGTIGDKFNGYKCYSFDDANNAGSLRRTFLIL
jgi:hypothetical protein